MFLLRWDQRGVKARQHSRWPDELEAGQQPGLGPEVYAGPGQGNAHISSLSPSDPALHWQRNRCISCPCFCVSVWLCSLVSWRSRCTGVTGVLFAPSSSFGWRTSWTTSATGCVCTWSRRECCLQRYTHTTTLTDTHTHTLTVTVCERIVKLVTLTLLASLDVLLSCHFSSCLGNIFQSCHWETTKAAETKEDFLQAARWVSVIHQISFLFSQASNIFCFVSPKFLQMHCLVPTEALHVFPFCIPR